MAASSKPTGKRAIWTAEEVDLLGSLVVDGDQNRRQVILSKGLQGDDRKKKKAAWDSVADEFNMRASVLDVGYSGWMRSAEQIKQRWHKGRSEAKNQNAVAKASVVSTGGGKIGVDKHLQNYLQGLSEEELEGCNDEEYGRRGWRSFEADDYVDPEVLRAIRRENEVDDDQRDVDAEPVGLRDIVERDVLRDEPRELQNAGNPLGFRQLARARRDRLANWLAFVRQAQMGVIN
ncbi:hypothetical protein FOL47_006488 [Perkinsus chesapeaki]|uniref:Myb/SANT-like DNA-binding domain-containing protein n=1 Tax=Perkinsus chesapeaki TaxID=330153 RepID=A0A7J6LS02_PERCH|nr:hypothetical protein FOL47_006488 [Perkinsus chesapeaki]